jgi:hypothetical protein
MGEDIPDVGMRACCVLKEPFDRNGPWTCPHCGLMHGWPIEPVQAAPVDSAEYWLAVRLSDARTMLKGEYAWLNLIESELVDAFASFQERRQVNPC